MFIAPYICHYHLHLFKCKNAKNAPFIHWLPFSRCFTYWQSHSSFQIHSALATIGPKWKGLQALCIILATVVVGEGNIEVFVMNMRMFRQRKHPPSLGATIHKLKLSTWYNSSLHLILFDCVSMYYIEMFPHTWPWGCGHFGSAL